MPNYTTQTWSDNNVSFPLSAARMNHLEAGIAAVDAAKSDTVSGAVASRALTTGADQTATINAEIAALGTAGGGSLQLPAGPITHATTLHLQNNVIIRGQGATTSLVYTGSGTAINQSTVGTRIYNTGLRDLALSTSTGATGIDIQDVSIGNFQNLAVSGFSSIGIRLRTSTRGWTVYNTFINCLVTSCVTGWSVETGSNSNRFVTCRGNACTTAGVSITDSNQNVWTDGQLEGNGTGWFVSATAASQTDGNVCAFTRFESNTVNWNIASSLVRDAVILYPLGVDGNGTGVDSGSTTQIVDNRTQFLSQVRVPNAAGSWKFVRTSSALSSEPAMWVADTSASNGTPITILAQTERLGGSFFQGQRAGTVFFNAKADGSLTLAGKLLTTGGLGVGNSAAATTPGTVVKKMQVFDAAGTSLGFVPIYNAITQTMATATLSNVLFDTTGSGASDITVRAQLVASSGFLADGTAEVITFFETASDDSGAWTMPITPLDEMEDPGAYYQVTEGRKQWFVNVPTAGDYNLRPQIINAPGSSVGGGGAMSGFLTGATSPPSGSLGSDGDAYLDTVHANLYRKVSGAWVGPTSLIGPGGGVNSVQGKTGTITTLSPTDLTPDALAASDPSVTNARTPTSHAASHATGGSDPVTLSTAGAASISLRPVLVQDLPDPLMNAVMDGTTHPLSSRFASLGLAQAKFPGAVALTDEIDYWAIQTQLNTVTQLDLGDGTAVVHKSLLLKAGGNQLLQGVGTGATKLFLRTGSNTNVISPADQTNPNPNITLRGFSVDGNASGNTGTIGQTDNILITRGDNLVIDDIESHHANGRGIHHHGLTGSTCQVQSWRRIYVHDNLHWGVHNSNGVRQVDYNDVKAIANGLRTDISLSNTGNGADSFTGGMLLDHSEVTAAGVQCHSNGQDGLWIRNAFAASLDGVTCTRNGRHGIRVLGFVDSAGNGWVSQSNGTNLSLVGHDVWFDGTSTLNYGITSRSRIDGMLAGPDHAASIADQGAWTGNEDYGVYFDDNMVNADVEIHAKVYAGTAGDVRFPTAGLGLIQYGVGASGTDRVENITAAGAAVTLVDVNVATMHRLVLTAAACVITLPPAGAGKVVALSLVQDATGGRLATFLAATGGTANVKWAGGGTPPTLTTSAGGADVVAFECFDGTHWVATVTGQNI